MGLSYSKTSSKTKSTPLLPLYFTKRKKNSRSQIWKWKWQTHYSRGHHIPPERHYYEAQKWKALVHFARLHDSNRAQGHWVANMAWFTEARMRNRNLYISPKKVTTYVFKKQQGERRGINLSKEVCYLGTTTNELQLSCLLD